MEQLDREFSERSKVESLLRELLDAKRNRKSEQLSADQLALFASLWQARQAERECRRRPGSLGAAAGIWRPWRRRPARWGSWSGR